jgi:hypothetical protein
MPKKSYHEALPPQHSPTDRESTFREDHLSAVEIGRRVVIELDGKLENGASKLLQESVFHYGVDTLESITQNFERRDSQYDVDRKTLKMFDNMFTKQASDISSRESWPGYDKVKGGLVEGDLVEKAMRGLAVGGKFEKYPAITHQIVKDEDPAKLDKYMEITFWKEPHGPDDGRRVFRFTPGEMTKALTSVKDKASKMPPDEGYEEERMLDNNVSSLLVIEEALSAITPSTTESTNAIKEIKKLLSSAAYTSYRMTYTKKQE